MDRLWIWLKFQVNKPKNTKKQYIYSLKLLKKINEFSPGFAGQGLKVSTNLEFHRNWGLGSSSTLINNISNWLNIDPYKLLKMTYKGSGYDIAVAKTKKSIFFEKKDEFNNIMQTNFSPPFKDNLFFIHLNKVNTQKSDEFLN